MTPPIRTSAPPRLLLAVVIVVVAAALYVVLWRMGEYPVQQEVTPPGVPAESRFAAYHRQFIGGRILDIYGYYYPSMLYAARSIRDGGRGLFWNPLQNCGQPFFAMIHAGLLYPAQLLSLPLGVDVGLRLIPFFNLVVAGFFTYLLCRELGAGTIASLCGAVAFELGNTMMETVGLVPPVSGSYVWLPAAMLFCERMLKAPSLSSVAGLALVLAIDLVAGFPQMTLYIYQLVVLRTAWECATRRAARQLRVVLSIALALVLAPLLAAVQLLPSLGVVRDSVRHVDLPLSQMSGQFGFWQWRDFRLALGVRASIHQPLTLLPVMFGGVALLAPGARRYAAFYLGTGVVCMILGLGPLTPMFEWYTSLPTGGIFRYPMRFMWLAGFCVAPLMALGVEAMLATEPAVGRRARTFGAVIMIWMAAGFYALVPDGLRSVELALVALAVTASGGAMVTPRLRTWIGAAVVAGLLVNLVAVPPNAWSYLVVSGRSLLFPYAPTFVRLRARMTAQDRVYLSFGWPFDSKFALTPKVATMFEVPALTDYEPLGTRRYAEFYEKLRSGGSPQSRLWLLLVGRRHPRLQPTPAEPRRGALHSGGGSEGSDTGSVAPLAAAARGRRRCAALRKPSGPATRAVRAARRGGE